MVRTVLRPAQVERALELPVHIRGRDGAGKGEIGGLRHRQLRHDARQGGGGRRAGGGVIREIVAGVGDMARELLGQGAKILRGVGGIGVKTAGHVVGVMAVPVQAGGHGPLGGAVLGIAPMVGGISLSLIGRFDLLQGVVDGFLGALLLRGSSIILIIVVQMVRHGS